jgi:hypothetical protein
VTDGGLLSPDGGLLSPDGGLLSPDGGLLSPDGGLLSPDGGLHTEREHVLQSVALPTELSQEAESRQIRIHTQGRGKKWGN